MKKLMCMLVTGMLAVSMLAGCGSKPSESDAADSNATGNVATTDEPADSAEFDYSEFINVNTREDGSGTRGAFIELFGVEEKNEAGEKVDNTTEEASVTNNTEAMLTTIAGDEYAIGYVSLGSLNETVKAVKIDGVDATVENIKSGSYAVSRPFNIAVGTEVSDVAQDFISFILSAEGQAVVEEKGYIAAVEGAEAFESNGAEGKIVVGGSSSVSPVMQKLIEAYQEINAGAEIELQTSDSTTGMTSTIDGTYDIGMASRELKDEEAASLTGTKIALDGIAVIVNNANPVGDITSENVKGIYVGEITAWDELK